jgi:hypothetical protein
MMAIKTELSKYHKPGRHHRFAHQPAHHQLSFAQKDYLFLRFFRNGKRFLKALDYHSFLAKIFENEW